MTRFLIQLGLLLASLVLAMRWGRWPERAAVLVYLAMMAIDQTFHFMISPRLSWQSPNLWHAGLDAAALVAIVTIALKSERIWTLWLGSAQILAVGAHLALLLDEDMQPLVFAILMRAPVWLAIIMTSSASAHLAWSARTTSTNA